MSETLPSKEVDPTIKAYSELAQREGSGITVTLYWEIGTINTVVEVADDKNDDYFVIDVPETTSPNTVFLHPFVYREAENGRAV